MTSQINQRIIIRPAKLEDKYEIVKIQYNALKFLSAKDYNPKQLNALLRSKSIARKSPETIFVAEINGQAVGFASLLSPPNTIGAVFVSPNFTRKNIGTMLLKRLEQEAAENKIPVLWVYSSLTGYSFYKVNGYKNVRKAFLPLYSTYIPCIQMKKRILPVSKDEAKKELSELFTALTTIMIVLMMLSQFT